jgi:hypothetical protein
MPDSILDVPKSATLALPEALRSTLAVCTSSV